MKKQQKIKEAYGEYWEKVKPDKNGNCLIISSGYPDIEWMYDGFGYNNPKSLQGIENNNGWIKIESEKDLPKEFGKYWVIDKDNAKMYQRELDKSTKGFFLKYSTHYQPIIKPQPPIY